MSHWYFETIDIAPLLKEGDNVLAALVWNMSSYAPGAQMMLMTGFILQGNSEREREVNTDCSWKVCRDLAYAPSPEKRQDVGCADIVKGGQYPWGWEMQSFDDTAWASPVLLRRGQPYGLGTGYDWMLCRRDIPLMEDTLLRMKAIRRTEGMTVPQAFLQGKAPLTIPNEEIGRASCRERV